MYDVERTGEVDGADLLAAPHVVSHVLLHSGG